MVKIIIHFGKIITIGLYELEEDEQKELAGREWIRKKKTVKFKFGAVELCRKFQSNQKKFANNSRLILRPMIKALFCGPIYTIRLLYRIVHCVHDLCSARVETSDSTSEFAIHMAVQLLDAGKNIVTNRILIEYDYHW